MKKILYIIIILAFVCACSGEQEAPFRGGSGGPRSELTFTTDFSKTALDGRSVAWAEGDSVKILWQERIEDSESLVTCYTVAPVNVSTGCITASVGDAADFFYAVYPCDADCRIEAGGKMSLTIPSGGDGSWARAQYAVARCGKDERALSFRNVSNVLTFSTSDPAVRNVRISRIGSGGAMIGTESFGFSANGSVPDASPVLSNQYIETAIGVNGAGTYYVPVVYGGDWSGNFIILMTDAEDKLLYFAWGKALEAVRNSIFDLGSFDSRSCSGDIFIKPSGSGDLSGSSWDNAGSVELLKFLIDNEIGGRVLDGRTVRLSEGTYDMYDKNCSNGICTITYLRAVSASFFGGYPSTSKGTSLAGRSPASKASVLTSTNPSTSHARTLYSNSANFNFTFDGITFTPKANSSFRGNSFYVNASCSGELLFNDCRFTGARAKTYASCCQFAAMNVRLKDCTISDNSFTYTIADDDPGTGRRGYGGTFEVSGRADVVFENCLFSGNSGTLCGSCVHCIGGALTLKGCTLENNSTTCDAAFTSTFDSCPGGAVSLSTYSAPDSGPRVRIDDCVFRNNRSSSCGADIYVAAATAGVHPEIFVNRSSFIGARVDFGGNNNNDASAFFQGKSVNSDCKIKDGEPLLCFYNCVLGQTGSTHYSNIPTIEAISTDVAIISSSLVDEGVAVLRNDKRFTTSGYKIKWTLLNNAVSNVNNSANAINLATATTDTCCHYNIMSYCKNAYSIFYDTSKKKASAVGKPRFVDDGFVLYEDMGWKFEENGNYYSFSIAAGKDKDPERPVRYTTSSFLESKVKSSVPEFDKWLKTIHDKPYIIDKRGSGRNPSKLQHGSWDPYL